MTDIGQLFENNSNCYADTWVDGIEGEVIMAMTKDRFIEIVSKNFPIQATNLKVGDQFRHINRNSDLNTVREKTPHTLIFTSGGGHVTFGIELTTYVMLVKSTP